MSSRKEKDVLEQQRKLARQLASKTEGSGKHQRPSSSSRSSSPTPPNGVARPSTIRPTTNRPSSAAKTLAAARARAQGTTKTTTTTSKQQRPSSHNIKKIANTAVARKSTTKKTGSSLSSLVQHLTGDAASDDTTSLTSFATNVTPNDFWKNLREWEFAWDLAKLQEDQKADREAKATAASSKAPAPIVSTKAIPDRFISVRHYMAAWAPLCLAEARAQLLSEVLTDCAHSPRKGQALLIPVTVETTWKNNSRRNHNNKQYQNHHGSNMHADLGDMASCQVMCKAVERRDNNRWQFFPHDVCCLVTLEGKDVVERLLRGGNITQHVGMDDELKKYTLVGHTEVSRREINGLVLRISKTKWAKVGTKQMFLLRVGGNITALREFTALSHVDMIPLNRYLLGQHLEQEENPSKKKNKAKAILPQTAAQKEMLLEKMGGEQALGKGFTAYAQKKFNPSQLMAISASAQGYGAGGFTLIKGPPGTGKTTTMVAVLNSLHIRQFNTYYEEVRRIASNRSGNRQIALEQARKSKPRLLVCAPSNAAVDNIILKIMEDGFIDGSGQRYNPSMLRVGVGQSAAVKPVALADKVDQILAENTDIGQLESSIAGFKMELQRLSSDIVKLRRRCHAIVDAAPWPLSKDWEIRVDDKTFDEKPRVFFVNHRDKNTSYECPPPPEPGETQFPAQAMPEYRVFMQRVVKAVEAYASVKSNLERSSIVKGSLTAGANQFEVRQSLEQHVLNSVHMVMTTLGTAGNRTLEGADKFEVVVVDEAAQSVEPATLSALRLGSRHCVLVGDPQQLPATIFNVTGKNTKYDRSLFQRLEEAGQDVFMLNEQYRMHPKISHFPRNIFYKGSLLDGPNVRAEHYGNPLLGLISSKLPTFQPFTVLDLDSTEERGGTSLSNSAEGHLAVHLFRCLRDLTGGFSLKSRVAVITPYSQQAGLLRRYFREELGDDVDRYVEVNTVDAFQGREAKIVIFSAVRAAGSHGIGFLSDVRRMNVALTRAKHFLFVIARCQSIVVNPYWRDLVEHARETNAVLRVPILPSGGRNQKPAFGNPTNWHLERPVNPNSFAAGLVGIGVPPPPPPPPRPNKTSSDPRKKPSQDKQKLQLTKVGGRPTDPRAGVEGGVAGKRKKNEKEPKPADPRKQKKRKKLTSST